MARHGVQKHAMVDPYRFTGLTGTGIPAYRLGRGSSSGLGYTQVRGLPETGFTQVQVQVQVQVQPTTVCPKNRQTHKTNSKDAFSMNRCKKVHKKGRKMLKQVKQVKQVDKRLKQVYRLKKVAGTGAYLLTQGSAMITLISSRLA